MDNPLGLESGAVRVVPYDRRWPGLYAAEIDRITPILADHGVELVLEHSGSTAVPYLAAKPIIDILAGLPSERDRTGAIEALESAGYVHRGERDIPGRDFFRRGNPRQFHVHLTTIGSEFWRVHRLFRDYLRTHNEEADEYSALKLALARRFPRDREAYIDGKTAFVMGVLSRADAEARRRR